MTSDSSGPFADRMDDALRRLWDGERDALAGLLGPTAPDDPLDELADAIDEGATIPTLVPGARLGGYRIVRRLGRGGMGIVYEAEQDVPRRRVALKVLRPTDATTEGHALLLRREVQALARLRHPGIAALYDAVLDPEGTCFFVMELVDGRPFDAHCDAAALGTRDRVRLVVDLCDAIVYAHERGVIHRDLKPANVLVEETGRVRVLDFGLAHLARREGEESLPSLHAGPAGTPEYMSPEQVSAAEPEVDVRSDVYSLGVLTYQVLLGRLPYAVPRSSPLAAAKAIAEAEPDRPRRLDPTFPRDLEAVVMKALEKGADRRYANVRELADDLRRFLDERPVEARELTLLYALGKLARRRKGLVAAAAISTLSVLAGIVALNVGLFRARAAERSAREEAAVARSVSGFQELLFSSANPDLAERAELSVRELLTWAAPRVDTMFSDSARAEAEVRTIIGRAFNSMGAFDDALPQLERVVALRRVERATSGDNADVELARALRNLAFLRHGMERFAEAEELHREALSIRRLRLGDRHEESVQSRIELAALLRDQGRLDEAISTLRAAHEACVPPGPRPIERLAGLLLDWSTCEILMGRDEQALVPLVEGWSRVDAESAALKDRIAVRCRRATLLGRLRERERARVELDQAIALAREADAENDRVRIAIHRELGEALLRHERAEEAVPYLEIAARLHEDRFGHEHAISRRFWFQLGEALSRAGEADRAEELLRATLAWQEETFGPDAREARRTRLALGTHLSRIGDITGARAVLEPGTDPRDDHPMSSDLAVRAGAEIGRLHLIEGSVGPAIAALTAARERVVATRDPGGELRAHLATEIARAQLLAGRPDQARHELASARAALKTNFGNATLELRLRTVDALVAHAFDEPDAADRLTAALSEIDGAPEFPVDLERLVRAALEARAR